VEQAILSADSLCGAEIPACHSAPARREPLAPGYFLSYFLHRASPSVRNHLGHPTGTFGSATPPAAIETSVFDPFFHTLAKLHKLGSALLSITC
jgi:hypothetical protein